MSPCVCAICICGGAVAALAAGCFIFANNEIESLEKCNEKCIKKHSCDKKQVRFLLEPSPDINDDTTTFWPFQPI